MANVSIMDKFFYYFGFGSNLLSKRIKIQNKSAERIGVGKLNGYRLDFADAAIDKRYFSPRWNGCPATIIENEGSHVYGAVWKINCSDLNELDRQEGVECEIYKPLEVNVFVQELNREIVCRTYQLFHNPASLLDPHDRPFERQPSKTYLTVILNGALESNLPQEYFNFLKSFKHNGRLAIDVNLMNSLGLKEFL